MNVIMVFTFMLRVRRWLYIRKGYGKEKLEDLSDCATISDVLIQLNGTEASKC